MIVTNSLGSNYSGEDIWLSLSLLFQPWRWKNGPQTEQLEDAIRKTYGDGRIASFQKGRQAIGEALRILKLLRTKELRFAAPSEISELTGGIQLGGIPPFGNLFGIKVFVEKTLLENEKIIFNAGDRSFSVAMKTKDYLEIVKPMAREII